jgi:hypothetical protein
MSRRPNDRDTGNDPFAILLYEMPGTIPVLEDSREESGENLLRHFRQVHSDELAPCSAYKEFPPPTIQTEIQIATKTSSQPRHDRRITPVPRLCSPQRLLPPIPWPQGTPEMQSLLGEDFLLSAHGAKTNRKAKSWKPSLARALCGEETTGGQLMRILILATTAAFVLPSPPGTGPAVDGAWPTDAI